MTQIDKVAFTEHGPRVNGCVGIFQNADLLLYGIVGMCITLATRTAIILSGLVVPAGIETAAVLTSTLLLGTWLRSKLAGRILGVPLRTPRVDSTTSAGECPLAGEARIRCICDPNQQASLGQLADLPFAPRVFWASWSVPMPPARRRLRLLGSIGLGAVALAISYAVLPTVPFAFWLFLMCTASALGVLFFAWLWPVYIRVVPGRLDILSLRHAMSQEMEVESIDLKTATVQVHLKEMEIAIMAKDRTLAIPYNMMPRGLECAQAVIWGALSTYDSGPPLPPGTLVD